MLNWTDLDFKLRNHAGLLNAGGLVEIGGSLRTFFPTYFIQQYFGSQINIYFLDQKGGISVYY